MGPWITCEFKNETTQTEFSQYLNAIFHFFYVTVSYIITPDWSYWERFLNDFYEDEPNPNNQPIVSNDETEFSFRLYLDSNSTDPGLEYIYNKENGVLKYAYLQFNSIGSDFYYTIILIGESSSETQSIEAIPTNIMLYALLFLTTFEVLKRYKIN